jgi:hypothetical protein
MAAGPGPGTGPGPGQLGRAGRTAGVHIRAGGGGAGPADPTEPVGKRLGCP